MASSAGSEDLSRFAPSTGETAGTLPTDHDVATQGLPAPVAMSLLNAIGEGVALATRRGDLHWANDLILRLGGGMAERLGACCRQFDRDYPLPPGGGGRVPSTVLELVLVDADKAWQVMLVPAAADLVRSAGLGPDTLVLVMRDVSAARRLQQKISAIDQAGSELVRVDPDTVRKFNAHERLKLLEDKIINVARNLLHFDHFAIRLLDERSGKLELVIGCNLPQSFDAFVIKPGLEGFGISGYVAASGRSYVCSDTATDPLYLPGVEGARSSLTVPLRLHDRVIGIMNVESLDAGAFGEEDRQLGEIFARYIAVAVHMLNLLVVERSTTNISVSGRVATELREPLDDIAREVELLRGEQEQGRTPDPHLERIATDIQSIRHRLSECAAGPASLLGVEQAMQHAGVDPVINGRRILVADDEQRIRKTIGDVLGKRGAAVTVCANGLEAIHILRDSPNAFDLVITDIRMPDHNGYEVFSAVKQFSPAAPVILMTGFGYDPHHSIVRASQEGLQGVLFKPFQVERLLDDVRKALAPKP